MWKTVLCVVVQLLGVATVAACASLWVSPYLGGIILGGLAFAVAETFERRHGAG